MQLWLEALASAVGGGPSLGHSQQHPCGSSQVLLGASGCGAPLIWMGFVPALYLQQCMAGFGYYLF